MKKRKVKRYDGGGTTEAVEMPEITEETESERRSKELLGKQGEIIGGAMAPRRTIENYMPNKPATKTGSYTSPVVDTSAEDEAEEVRAEMMRRRAAERRARERRKAEAERQKAAEKQSVLKGEEYAARKMGEGYKKAAEAGMAKAAEKKSGFGPKLTFNTPEKLEKARKAYYSGFKAGGKVSSASKRADGIATKGKTRGRIC
jgi:hypothetical protein